uniref:Importin N-terminal domain-containing protein n=1 Tax=Steinernema glaseri TaxID=37863 RepID=A0A1I8AX63_9BILA
MGTAEKTIGEQTLLYQRANIAQKPPRATAPVSLPIPNNRKCDAKVASNRSCNDECKARKEMANRIDVLANALQRTLSPDLMTRKNAENELKAMENEPGHGVVVLQLANTEAAPPEIRLASVVALKNYVKRNWAGDGDATISDEERVQIREESLRLMFALSGNLRKQLVTIVCEIGKSDFPSKWPALVEVLSANLATQNLDQIIASLDLLDDLSKKYRTESKSQELWVELKFVLDNLSGPLLALFQAMMGFYDQREAMPADQCINWLEILHLIASNFCSLSSQDLPEPFEDNISVWMAGFQTLLGLKIPSIEQAADDKVASPLEGVKVSICEIITLYTQRYEEETAQYVSPFIQGTWEQLVEIDHRYRFDSLVNACLGLLSAICQRIQYKSLFEEHGDP